MARILLIDNEVATLRVLTLLLSAEGYEVSAFREPDKAVDAIKAQDFDLIISDIRMSPINGMELLRIARQERPATPVIMLTAYGNPESEAEARNLGAYDYVTKPFNVDHLLAIIQRGLQIGGGEVRKPG